MIILYIFLRILALIFLILAPRMFRPDTNEIDRKRSQGE